MDELKLYKLLVTEDNEHGIVLAEEIRWVSEDELLIWVSYTWIKELMDSLKSMFGYSMFDDGGFEGNFQESGVCIDLVKALDGYGLELKDVFPPDKYK